MSKSAGPAAGPAASPAACAEDAGPVDVTIIGAGGFGRECLDVVEAVEAAHPGSYRVLGVVDCSPSDTARRRLADRDVPWLGSLDDWLADRPTSWFVVAIGSPEVRAGVAARLEAAGLEPATIVHPAATIGTRSALGPGSVVCAGAQVSTGVTLGRHVHVNPNATIGHDTVLADHVSVNPGAVVSGDATVEPRTLVGAGAVVLQGLTVGHGSVIGAAACVTRDVEPGTTCVGVPARPLRRAAR